MKKYYEFSLDSNAYRSIYHLINYYSDSIGIELGVYRANSFCGLLSFCPSIKKLHGVDNYKPHIDTKYDKTGVNVDDDNIKLSKEIAIRNIKNCKNNDKAILYESNTSDIVNNFSDEFFDFVLIDSYMNYEDVSNEVTKWWPKVRSKGFIAGHDWDTPAVQSFVIPFFKAQNILISHYDNLWVCFKK